MADEPPGTVLSFHMLPCKCFICSFVFSCQEHPIRNFLNQTLTISENSNLQGQQCQGSLPIGISMYLQVKLWLGFQKCLHWCWHQHELRHVNSNREILGLSVQQWYWKDYDKDEQQQYHQFYHATILVMQPGNKNYLSILLEQQQGSWARKLS